MNRTKTTPTFTANVTKIGTEMSTSERVRVLFYKGNAAKATEITLARKGKRL